MSAAQRVVNPLAARRRGVRVARVLSRPSISMWGDFARVCGRYGNDASYVVLVRRGLLYSPRVASECQDTVTCLLPLRVSCPRSTRGFVSCFKHADFPSPHFFPPRLQLPVSPFSPTPVMTFRGPASAVVCPVRACDRLAGAPRRDESPSYSVLMRTGTTLRWPSTSGWESCTLWACTPPANP